ncbi:MAG: Sec-independent protein translocase protein TatB [Burkholderiaceae bacterium]
MFNVSFSELLMIGVIALIVIGPERLPKVARTIGHLVGRAQRYVSDVKSDIQREMDIDDIGSLKGQLEDAARSIKETVQNTAGELRKPMDEAQAALKDAGETLKETSESLKASVANTGVSTEQPAEHPAEPAPEALAAPPPEPEHAIKPPAGTTT